MEFNEFLQSEHSHITSTQNSLFWSWSPPSPHPQGYQYLVFFEMKIHNFFYYWGIVFYKVVLVSTVQQSEVEFPVLYSRF